MRSVRKFPSVRSCIASVSAPAGMILPSGVRTRHRASRPTISARGEPDDRLIVRFDPMFRERARNRLQHSRNRRSPVALARSSL